ncbi:uncharacterized protein LOC119330927 [Triticum dicoccoides]|uniref:uncharacterized protein LOC119330927 n=1 Tax=Triticum dicoccoides TaxID=85692 RepID=UPI000E790C84|nr:uncharacterized protein LOC119330927 [Triticum dicoccoides]
MEEAAAANCVMGCIHTDLLQDTAALLWTRILLRPTADPAGARRNAEAFSGSRNPSTASPANLPVLHCAGVVRVSVKGEFSATGLWGHKVVLEIWWFFFRIFTCTSNVAERLRILEAVPVSDWRFGSKPPYLQYYFMSPWTRVSLLGIQLILLVFFINGSLLVLPAASAYYNASAPAAARVYLPFGKSGIYISPGKSGNLNVFGGPRTATPHPHANQPERIPRRRERKH